MAIIKQATNMRIKVHGTSTIRAGKLIKVAESINIDSQMENLTLVSNKKINVCRTEK